MYIFHISYWLSKLRIHYLKDRVMYKDKEVIKLHTIYQVVEILFTSNSLAPEIHKELIIIIYTSRNFHRKKG